MKMMINAQHKYKISFRLVLVKRINKAIKYVHFTCTFQD